MPDLSELIAAHAAALSTWDAIPDGEWDSPRRKAVDARLDEARDTLLGHRPATLNEVREKALYMASCRAFTEWDNDFDQVKLIEALTPVGGANG